MLLVHICQDRRGMIAIGVDGANIAACELQHKQNASGRHIGITVHVTYTQGMQQGNSRHVIDMRAACNRHADGM